MADSHIRSSRRKALKGLGTAISGAVGLGVVTGSSSASGGDIRLAPSTERVSYEIDYEDGTSSRGQVSDFLTISPSSAIKRIDIEPVAHSSGYLNMDFDATSDIADTSSKVIVDGQDGTSYSFVVNGAVTNSSDPGSYDTDICSEIDYGNDPGMVCSGRIDSGFFGLQGTTRTFYIQGRIDELSFDAPVTVTFDRDAWP